METKLVQKTETTMPAGIINGTEAFWFEGGKWVIHHGQTMKFEDAPGAVQRMIANAFMNDVVAHAYLKRMGIENFTAGFDRWYRCRIGTIDSTPDFADGKFTPDAFNSACKDFQCVHRGRLCSLKPGFKHYEVDTIRELKKGNTIEHTANELRISTAGLKSRVEKMKEKVGARNMAQLIAISVEYGM